MAKKVEIDVVIEPDGNVVFHVKGTKGKECLDYVELMKLKLGELIQLDKTSEFYLESQNTNRDEIHRKNSQE